jgi:hypothetical protein
MTNENNNEIEKKIIYNKISKVGSCGKRNTLFIPLEIAKRLNLSKNHQNYIADWKIIRVSRGERYKHIIQVQIKRKMVPDYIEDTQEETIL